MVGTVTNEVGGAGLAGITVYLVENSVPSNPDPVLVATGTTNGAGQYDLGSQFTSGAVPNGTYAIRFFDAANNFISEYNLNAATRTTAMGHVRSIATEAASAIVQRLAGVTPDA